MFFLHRSGLIQGVDHTCWGTWSAVLSSAWSAIVNCHRSTKVFGCCSQTTHL